MGRGLPQSWTDQPTVVAMPEPTHLEKSVNATVKYAQFVGFFRNATSEYGWTLSFVFGYFGHHVRRGHTWLAAPYRSGFDGSRLIVPAQYLGDAAVGDLEDARDVARTGAAVRQFHDLLSRGIWQGPPVHVHAAQLVDTAVACKDKQTEVKP
ncbi:hypothetical protein CDAR_42161 [Caerostris darwini]|uniref:Uncharacterized protein n=1 Tax=Caerostris darwini TaxID=1538125 RepID=A0AAV4RLN5_9ARAC|nr:hypothetical protein CDAR_42161 [Caerostris darwini]